MKNLPKQDVSAETSKGFEIWTEGLKSYRTYLEYTVPEKNWEATAPMTTHHSLETELTLKVDWLKW